jgi:hypothetical protein
VCECVCVCVYMYACVEVWQEEISHWTQAAWSDGRLLQPVLSRASPRCVPILSLKKKSNYRNFFRRLERASLTQLTGVCRLFSFSFFHFLDS